MVKNTMKIIECFINQSNWLKQETRKIRPMGVLWHSTGANNTNIKRYVQPDDNAANRDELISVIGKNRYSNDWNHIDRDVGVSFFIGTLNDGSVGVVQCGPDNIRQWGCDGALNNTHIQFEICESALSDESYFKKVYEQGIELTAYLCEKYGLDPLGSFTYNGKTVPVITDHAGSYSLGMGSNHGDVGHWFRRYLGNDYLNKIRQDVKNKMQGGCGEMGCPYWNGSKCTKDTPKIDDTLHVGDTVKMDVNATVYGRTYRFASWVYNATLYVREISGDRIVVSTLRTGAITGAVDKKYLKKV